MIKALHTVLKAHLSICLFAWATLHVSSQAIVVYANGPAAGAGPLVSNAANVNVGLTSAVLVQYNGAGPLGSPCTDGMSNTGAAFNAYTSFDAVNGPYIGFSVFPAAGYFLDVTGFAAGIRCSATGATLARLEYSTDGGLTWIDNGSDINVPYSAGCQTAPNGSGNWNVSFAADAINGVQFRIYGYSASGSSGNFQLHTVELDGSVVSCNSINIPQTMFTICAGQGANLSATGANSYLWSPASGLSSSIISNPIASPANTTVYTLNGCPTKTDTVNVIPTVQPGITIVADTNNICAGVNVNFTATDTNGGTTPFYQWTKNGIDVGSNSPNYNDGGLNSGDVISCIIVSNAVCAVPDTVASNGIVMNVTIPLAATLSITANNTSICAGASVNFTANAGNGGTLPVYQWIKNGNDVGSNTATYSDGTLNDGDIISCVLISNAACASPDTASDSITITVNPVVTPTISISFGADTICAGTNVDFNAVSSGGGNTPVYQWQKNGVDVGTNNAAYTGAGLVNGDVITCMLTSSAFCALPNTVADTLAITVLQAVAGSISAIEDTVCSGSLATLSTSGSSGNVLWQSSTDGISFNTVGSDTAYAAQITQTTYFRIVVNSGLCTDTSAIFTVASTPAPVPVFTDSVLGTQITFNSAGTTFATGYSWSFGDGDTSNLPDPVHVFAVADSSYQVCLTVYNGSTCSATYCKDLTTANALLIAKVANSKWLIYPNPASTVVNFSFNNMYQSPVYLTIFDNSGRAITTAIDNGAGHLQIDCRSYAGGLYFYSLITDSTVLRTGKFEVVH